MADEEKNNENEEKLPVDCIPEIDDFIKKLPEDEQKTVKKSISRRISLSMQGVMPMSNPIYEKLDTKLLGKLIDNSENESVREYEQEKFNRICGIIVLLIVIVAVVFLLCVFRNHVSDINDIIRPIIYIGLGAVSGFVGGYGYCKIKND